MDKCPNCSYKFTAQDFLVQPESVDPSSDSNLTYFIIDENSVINFQEQYLLSGTGEGGQALLLNVPSTSIPASSNVEPPKIIGDREAPQTSSLNCLVRNNTEVLGAAKDHSYHHTPTTRANAYASPSYEMNTENFYMETELDYGVKMISRHEELASEGEAWNGKIITTEELFSGIDNRSEQVATVPADIPQRDTTLQTELNGPTTGVLSGSENVFSKCEEVPAEKEIGGERFMADIEEIPPESGSVLEEHEEVMSGIEEIPTEGESGLPEHKEVMPDIEEIPPEGESILLEHEEVMSGIEEIPRESEGVPSGQVSNKGLQGSETVAEEHAKSLPLMDCVLLRSGGVVYLNGGIKSQRMISDVNEPGKITLKRTMEKSRNFLKIGKPGKYLCDICGRRFSDKTSFCRHKYDVHIGRKFPCTMCERAYTRKQNLQRHFRKDHTAASSQ